MKKSVILHYHLFKNAGTTIDGVLDKNFGKNATRIDVDKPKGILPNEVVLQFLNKNPNIESISSHQLRFPVPENNEFNFLPMIFIRHPIDRIFSIHSYNKRRTDVKTLGVENAKRMDISEYITWNLNSKRSKVMKNFQVLFMSKSNNDVDAIIDDLEIAKKRLKGLFIFGVVDRLDESLVLAEERLCPFFNKIDFSYIKKNVSTNRSNDLEERIHEAQNSIGDKLMNRLKEKNSLDQQLYDFSNCLLDEKIDEIKNFDEKMENFKNRCNSVKNKILSMTSRFKNRRIWYSEEKSMLYYNNKKKGIIKDILSIKTNK